MSLRRVVALMTLFVLATATWGAPARAAESPGFSQLVRSADLILAGTIQNVDGVWNKDHSEIFSFITLGDLDVVDGEYSGKTLVFRQDGGEVKSMFKKTKQAWGHVPEFDPGQRVLLFMTAEQTYVTPIAQLEAGTFRLAPDASGKTRVRSWRAGVELAGVAEDRLLFKVPRPQQPTITASSRSAQEAFTRAVTERDAAYDAVLKRDYSYDDFKKAIRAEAARLRAAGTKSSRPVKSADPSAELPIRQFKAVAPRVLENR